MKKGQIIFGKRRAYQRKVAVADWDCICSAHAMVIEANPKNVIPEFLPFFMQSESFMSRAIAISEGSLSPTIKWKVLEQQKFSIPSLSEQNRLLPILLKKFEIEQLTVSVYEQANLLHKVFLQDLICKKATEKSVKNGIPDGWELKRLINVATYQLGKAFPSTDYCNDGVKLLRPGNLYQNGFVGWSPQNTISMPHRYLEESRSYLVGENEIVMNLTAQSLDDGFLGRVCLTLKGERCLLNQRLAQITPKAGIDYKYLFWALQSRFVREYLHRMPVGTKVKHLYNFEIENIPILYPASEDEQNKLAGIMDYLFLSKEQLQEKRIQLSRVKLIEHMNKL